MGTMLSSEARPKTTSDAQTTPATPQEWSEFRHGVLNRLNCIKLSVTVIKRAADRDPDLLAELLRDIDQAADEINEIIRGLGR